MRTLDLANADGLDVRVAGRCSSLAGLNYFVVHAGWHEPREQVVEGFVVVDPDGLITGVVVLVDIDLGEEGLVEQPPGLVVGLQVGGVAVAAEVEGVREERSRLLEVGVEGGEALLDAEKLTGDAILLRLEQVEGDGARVMGVKQLVPLCGERDALLFHLLAFACRGGLERVEVGQDEFLDAVA